VLEPFDWSHAIARTTLTLPKVALLGLIVGLVLRRSSPRALARVPTRLVAVGAAAIVAGDLLSAIPGTYIDALVRETLKAIEYLTIFVACTVALDNDAESNDRELRFALVGVVGVVTLLAFAQLHGGAPSAFYVRGHAIPRIAGPLEGPNQLAGYLGLAIPLLVALAVAYRDRAAAIVAAAAGAALVLTFSRGGLLATFAAVVAMLAMGRRHIGRGVALGIAACAIAVGGALAYAGVAERFSTFGNASTPSGLATRPELWAAAIDLWRTSPWLGVGAGNYELLLPTVGLVGVRTHANSAYLGALAEGGLPLLAALLFSTVVTIVALARLRRNAWALGAMGAALSLGIHQIVDSLTFYPKIGDTYWTLVAIALARATSLVPQPEPTA